MRKFRQQYADPIARELAVAVRRLQSRAAASRRSRPTARRPESAAAKP